MKRKNHKNLMKSNKTIKNYLKIIILILWKRIQ